MRPRDAILMFAGLGLAGVILSMLWAGGGGSLPAPSSPGSTSQDRPAVDPLQADPAAASAAQAPLRGGAPDRLAPVAGMTSGIIRGGIALDPEVVERIRSITVSVRELAANDGGRPPYSRSRSIAMGNGTPRFEFSGVPFSAHGYSVSVFSPGLNGSEQTVAVTEADPIAEALLDLSPPVAFSVLLRDQFLAPVNATPVLLKPVDLPLGRGPLAGTSDNFGSLLFEDVLAGDYLIFVGDPSNPLVDPVRVTVQPPGVPVQPAVAHVRGEQLKHQFAPITVPRGQALQISVVGPAGIGLKDARLSMHSVSSVRYQPYEGITDYSGRHVFPHLPPGEYQLTVELDGHQRRTTKIEWRDGEEPPRVEVRLFPLQR